MVTPARQTDPFLRDIRRGMLAAAALLIGLASLIGLAGLATVAAALATACRRWYGRADLAPAELARLEWEQAKAAATASGGAWRETDSGAKVQIGVDGEALVIDPPVIFESRPGALRVRLPLHAMHVSPASRATRVLSGATLTQLGRVALGKPGSG